MGKNKTVHLPLMNIKNNVFIRQKNRNLRKVRFESIEELFSNVSGRTELTIDEFKKLIPSKDVRFDPCVRPSSRGVMCFIHQAFFAERVFRILDKDCSNGISTSELRLGLEQLCSQSAEDRVRFLFQIYDRDGIYSINKS